MHMQQMVDVNVGFSGTRLHQGYPLYIVGGVDCQEAFLRPQGWFSGLDSAVRRARRHLHKPCWQSAHSSSVDGVYLRNLLIRLRRLRARLKPTRFSQGLDPSPQSFLLIIRSGRLHRREHSRPRSMPMIYDETCGHGQRQLQRPPKASARGPRGWPSVQRPAPGFEWVWLQVKQIGKRREVTCKGQPNGSAGVPDGDRNGGLVDRLRRPLTGTSTTLGRHQGGSRTQQSQRVLFVQCAQWEGECIYIRG